MRTIADVKNDIKQLDPNAAIHAGHIVDWLRADKAMSAQNIVDLSPDALKIYIDEFIDEA